MSWQWILQPRVIPVACSMTIPSTHLDRFTGSFSFARPDHLGEPTVKDLDVIPELAGRVCYNSFTSPRPGENKAYLKHILEAGHGSVLEHSVITLLITGVSRSLTHELIRHRAGTGFSELSQRFFQVDGGKIGFVMPPSMIGDADATELMASSIHAAMDNYVQQVTVLTKKIGDEWVARNPDKKPEREDLTYIRKSARQAARAVLPNCCETHIVMTANLRAWRNILEQRGSIHADLEIRRLACAIAFTIQSMAPNTFQDMTISKDVDSWSSVHFEHRKV
jgi:thymidylate synthase (FAD)